LIFTDVLSSGLSVTDELRENYMVMTLEIYTQGSGEHIGEITNPAGSGGVGGV
jgi:hypothetical protein